ncbi:histone deacetylase complex subunit SAP18 [Rhodotorula toruloides]|uniref:Histone deacetylase complex subunit SAP18 n=1 Tax=Rhodotorula toruloides TaxID=5286 RepID=A0A511KF69_RHOTO|nr:histone deacetylase complex subunit SAP18 [Rhodotorula toruloides]
MNRTRQGRQPPQRRVDREKTCPSLLRVFVRTGQHHPDTDFTTQHVPSADEHQLYTWRDTTLREIINLVLDSSPRVRSLIIPSVPTSTSSSATSATLAPPAAHSHSPNARLSFRIVFFDPSLSRFTSTDLASFSVRDLVSSTNPPTVGRGGAPVHIKLERTLEDAKFVAGDLLDIAILGLGPPDAGAPTLVPPAIPGPRGGSGVFGIRGAAGGPGAGANGFVPRGPAAGGGGPSGGPGPKWAQPGGPRGGPRGAGAARAPTDQGWGAAPRGPAGGRRVSDGGGGGRYDDRDRPSGPLRPRSSRSRSPVARPSAAGGLDYDRPPHQRGRDRSMSPVRRGRDDDVDMRD